MAKKTHPKTLAMETFNGEVAPSLAEKVGDTKQITPKGWSKRFAYFLDQKDQLVIVAGDQEEEDVDLALAFGLTYRDQRPLVLVLPEHRAFPTLQRAPWLVDSAQPSIFRHDGKSVVPVALPTTDETIERLRQVRKPLDPRGELRAAAMPLHLGDRSGEVFALVEWATKDRRLDPGHRQGERSWHYMGQRVLSIRRSRKDLNIRGGIHTTKTGEPAFDEDDDADAPTATTAEIAIKRAEQGIKARLHGAHHRPDEHWLQAVIRRDPTLAGVEQPALREVPAWRPTAKPNEDPDQPGAWGRGFIDLVGLDGHGNLRIVETKLTKNQDELLFLQGLDYYVWACAYKEVLLERLGASKQAKIEVHYVIGDNPDTKKVKVSRYAAAVNDALTIPRRVQTVHDWYYGPEEQARAHSNLLPKGTLPSL
jgi:hypothetical protein